MAYLSHKKNPTLNAHGYAWSIFNAVRNLGLMLYVAPASYAPVLIYYALSKCIDHLSNSIVERTVAVNLQNTILWFAMLGLMLAFLRQTFIILMLSSENSTEELEAMLDETDPSLDTENHRAKHWLQRACVLGTYAIAAFFTLSSIRILWHTATSSHEFAVIPISIYVSEGASLLLLGIFTIAPLAYIHHKHTSRPNRSRQG